MTIDDNFFQEVHSIFKEISKKYIIPHIGNLDAKDISEKPDKSKVTKYDLIVEEELISFFKNRGFKNIISEEFSSDLLERIAVLSSSKKKVELAQTPTLNNSEKTNKNLASMPIAKNKEKSSHSIS